MISSSSAILHSFRKKALGISLLKRSKNVLPAISQQHSQSKATREFSSDSRSQKQRSSFYKFYSENSDSKSSNSSNITKAIPIDPFTQSILLTALVTGVVLQSLNSLFSNSNKTNALQGDYNIKHASQNTAFIFIKPHANTPETRTAIRKDLLKKKFQIKKEGQISAEEIEKKNLIDHHYYSIASKATLLSPKELVMNDVNKTKFKHKFGSEWNSMLESGKVMNAKEACQYWNISADELNKHWAKSKNAGKLVKFGGGFYCALIDTCQGPKGTVNANMNQNAGPLYVMNGFFMSMRKSYVEKGSSIYYYVVEWNPDQYSWSEFRSKVIGTTDPATAERESLRGQILDNWRFYGLKDQPNIGENGLHASASPFESLTERMNWLDTEPKYDKFGRLVLEMVGRNVLSEWKKDPMVKFGKIPIVKSVFDCCEDSDSSWCLALLGMMKGQMVI